MQHRFINYMKRAYVIGLSLVAVISSLAFITTNNAMRNDQTGAKVINVSGRQRMLSQEMAFFVEAMVNSPNMKTRSFYQAQLHSAIDRLKQGHSWLLGTSASKNLTKYLPADLRSASLVQQAALEQELNEFVSQANALANSNVAKLQANNSHLAAILTLSPKILTNLDATVNNYQLESEARIAAMEFVEKVFLVIILCTILGEAIFVFRPLTKSLELESDRLQKANQELDGLSRRDELTGLANRRYFNEALTATVAHAARLSEPIGFIMCDIDFFKSYNDNYGHLEGDQCLKLVAQALRNGVKRESDLLARYGGEEFAVILPGVPLAGVFQVANELSASVNAAAIPHAYSSISAQVTLSFGVTSIIPTGGMEPSQIVDKADAALYEAKRNGRNQVAAA
ncbi:MAG: diguanylate cyclase [Peptococcaceae bacterium]|nr:diguanylate cyclase [Peptococcaceae bacterium]